jgi:hypothetical protein
MTIVTTARLNYGWTKSCKCLQRQRGAENGKNNRRHGHTLNGGSSEYWSWTSMKQRCLNPNYHHFKNWGGRGIKICKRWLDGFENFLADMGPKPSRHHTLDRINNNGNYTPNNCRWSLPKKQATNRRG